MTRAAGTGSMKAAAVCKAAAKPAAAKLLHTSYALNNMRAAK